MRVKEVKRDYRHSSDKSRGWDIEGMSSDVLIRLMGIAWIG